MIVVYILSRIITIVAPTAILPKNSVPHDGNKAKAITRDTIPIIIIGLVMIFLSSDRVYNNMTIEYKKGYTDTLKRIRVRLIRTVTK
jgi:hypothetical protein